MSARARVQGGLREQIQRPQSLDGREYKPEMEEELNKLFWRVFKEDDGQKILSYLKNLTINVSFDHTITPEQLLHFEGRRWIVSLMLKRFQTGEKT
jgi:hypothetical protein